MMSAGDLAKPNELSTLASRIARGVESAYGAGYDAGKNGLNTSNCDSRFFGSSESSDEWSRGNGAGKVDKPRPLSTAETALGPLRKVVCVGEEARGYPVERLECGHELYRITRVGDADVARRRCGKCRDAAKLGKRK